MAQKPQNLKQFIILKTLCLAIMLAFVNPVNGQVFDWAIGLGSPLDDDGQHVTTDADGNAYITGGFMGVYDADPGPAVSNLTPVGVRDFFIQKLDSAGNLVWAGSVGCSGYNINSSEIRVDAAGFVYLTGSFYGGGDFDPGPGVFIVPGGGGEKAFIMKLDNSGNLVWVKWVGTGYTLQGESIDVDATGNIYVTGAFFGSADMNPDTAATYYMSSNGGFDFFLLKLDQDGNFVWAFDVGGNDAAYGQSVVCGPANTVYVAGYYNGLMDFDPGAGTTNLPNTVGTANNAFVACYDSSRSFIWAKAIGTTGNELCRALSVDAQGNAFAAGGYSGTSDFDPSAATFTLTAIGGTDGFLVKLNATGDFQWAQGFGNVNWDECSGIEADANGNVFFTGFYSDTIDLDPGAGTQLLISTGSIDAFVCSLDSAGNFRWARSMGGVALDKGYDLAVMGTDQLYVTGTFDGVMFVDASLPAGLTSNGTLDIFLVRYSPSPLGVIPNPGDVSLLVYPNPTNGQFNISLGNVQEDVKISLTDLAGRLIQSNSVYNQSEIRMDVEGPAGCYLVRVESGGGVQMRKVIKL